MCDAHWPLIYEGTFLFAGLGMSLQKRLLITGVFVDASSVSNAENRVADFLPSNLGRFIFEISFVQRAGYGARKKNIDFLGER